MPVRLHALTCLVGLASLALIGPAAAASLEVKHAVANLVVIPEARQNIAIEIVGGDPKLSLKQSGSSDRVVLDGGIRDVQCGSQYKLAINDWNATRLQVVGVGTFNRSALPKIIARVPLNAEIAANGTVFGTVGRTESLDLELSGCGDWTVANVEKQLRLNQSGSGDARIGEIGSGKIELAGSGDISLVSAAKGLKIAIAGSGDVAARSVSGPLDIDIAGSGDVSIEGGQVDALGANIAGSGDISFGGTAAIAKLNVVGSGDISLHKVTGSVNKSVMGSGDISIGQ